MQRAKILIILRPAEGGIVKHVNTIIKNLSGKFAFTVACPQEEAKFYRHLPCQIIEVPISGTFNLWHDLQALSCLRRAVDGGSYALLHAHGFKAGFVARLLSGFTGIPCLVTIHSEFAHAKASRMASIYILAEQWLARRTKKYITVSEWLKQDLMQKYKVQKEQVCVISNGIELKEFAAAQKPPSFWIPQNYYVGTVARLAPQKGVDIFLQAAAALLPFFPQTYFVIAGEGPLRRELEKLAQDLGIKERVIFLGKYHEIPALLKCLDVFVLASRSEAQGIAALEAMAAGCPVIASNVGGLKEIIKDKQNGLLFPAENAKALAAAIYHLLKNPKEAKRLAKQAQIDVQKYSIERQVLQMQKLYEKMLEGGKVK
ncbi:MAG: glycosyltransferase family 4 protein [Firmicutes bacterium]|nr:glycosyltransferase family 4 protein [Bacillota bacterium]